MSSSAGARSSTTDAATSPTEEENQPQDSPGEDQVKEPCSVNEPIPEAGGSKDPDRVKDGAISLIIKWSGQEIVIDDLMPNESISDMKQKIYRKTCVRPERQKIMGLRLKEGGKPAPDTAFIQDLNIRPGTKVMMMGTKETEEKVVDLAPEDVPQVFNDFDIEEDEVNEINVANREENLAKIQRRVKEYQIKEFNPPRPGKKLLVLDIDYTFFDHRSVAEHASQLMRPYLHEFLAAAYEDYDIVIWSATSMKWIEVKMRELGVEGNPNYKINFYLDSLAMISVYTPKYGLVDVKPLGVIWGKYPGVYTPQNTIMFDDIRRNFLMNPQNGLKIRPFREAFKNQATDRELLHLKQYLKKIATLKDFSHLDHRKWEKYLGLKRSQSSRNAKFYN